MRLRLLKSLWLLSVALVVACSHPPKETAGAGACGPFGNAPAGKVSEVHPNCGDGKLLGPWKDADGVDRYACLYVPDSPGANRKLPMVVYMHPSLFPAGWITQTNILAYMNSASLSGDPRNAGYIVLAPEGRNTTHYYPFPDSQGVGWDNWYRQLSPGGAVKVGGTEYAENVDAATIDHFIAEQVMAGNADTDRIYVTGWSNGAAMAYLYALNRSAIAAAAVYSGPDPFGAFNDPCPQVPVAHAPANDREVQIFNPHVPIMHVRNSCDIGGMCPSGEKLDAELRQAGVATEDMILDDSGRRVKECTSSCGTNPMGETSAFANPIGAAVGLKNHTRWPLEWTETMLVFFREHPLKPRPH